MLLITASVLESYKKLGTVCYFIIAVLLAGNFLNASFFINQINRADSWSRIWSPAIYQLASHLEDQAVSEVFCLDWGLCTQIKALAKLPQHATIHDIWPSFRKDPKLTKVEDLRFLLRSNSNDLTKLALVEFLPAGNVPPQVAENRAILFKSLIHFNVETKTIKLGDNGYLVHNLKRKSD